MVYTVSVAVGFGAARPGRREAVEFSARADDAEFDVGESDEPLILLDLGKPNRLTGECLGDEHVPPLPLDRAVLAHGANLMVGIVPRRLGFRRIGPGRFPMAAGRRRLAQRLVRPLLVE